MLLAHSPNQNGGPVLSLPNRVKEATEADGEDAETDLFRRREVLDSVLDYAPGFIMAIDEHGKLQFINRVLPQYDKKSVIGSDWSLYLPPEQVDTIRVGFRDVLKTGSPKTYESSVAGADGERVWFTTHMGPIKSGDRVVGVVLVAQEITELRRAQLEVTSAQRMAAVGTLAAGIAHEINTPVQFVGDSLSFLREGMQDIMTVVDGLQNVCRLVAQELPSAAVREALASVSEAEALVDLPYLRENLPQALDRCVDGLGRVSSIVNSIQEFAHPAGKDVAPVDLNRAIANTLTIARNAYTDVAELETDLRELPPVTCHVDQINQVVLNLLLNAAHAIGDVFKSSGVKGHLTVGTRMEGEDVVICISDTGAGIPEAIRGHIFEPFFTTKKVGEGTGQGLALAWKLVTEKHGGTLSFETILGKGTTFFVRLPRVGKSQAAAGAN
jgi:two-component system NtrC family sensor kinase